MKVKAGETTKAPKGGLREKKGRKAILTNKDLPAGVHIKDRWHKHFLPTVFWWVAQQKDPWNLADEDVVKALQQIWDVIYKNTPYEVEVRDAVFAVVRIILFGICCDTYNSDRQRNVSVTHGAQRSVLRLSLSSIASSKTVMMTSRLMMSAKCLLRNR